MASDNVIPIDADTARLLARRTTRFRWFVFLLALTYLAAAIPVLALTPLPPLGLFAMLAVLVVLAEHRFVLFGDETSMSASIIVVVASVFAFATVSPLAGPFLIASLGGLYFPHLRRGSLHKAGINAMSMGLAALLSASLPFFVIGFTHSLVRTVGAIALGTASYWLMNNCIVAGYLTTARGYDFSKTTRHLLTSETDVLTWVALASVGVVCVIGSTFWIGAVVLTVGAIRVVTTTAPGKQKGRKPRRSRALVDDRLASWLLAAAVLVMEGTPTEADVVFAITVAALAGRYGTPRQRFIAVALPAVLVSVQALPWAVIAILLTGAIACLSVRPRSVLAWSICVTIGSAAWMLADQKLMARSNVIAPHVVLAAALIPGLVSLAAQSIRSYCIASTRDPWVCCGLMAPTRSDLLFTSAVSLAASLRVDSLVLFIASTVVMTIACTSQASQRPEKFAERFSLKAISPSCRSSL